ncbi:hypothetical protein O1611_g4729 [Lasiodiplodia mahajangana]|uniref:Uncharacterized protein n=1 Tax=Lasiodiplodia mahajangana TaxID=1108764 RepID=A0ACC2JNH1_9PEZI|nr:hypothetical protein O1611_g4729 [Lasiodiplodia mahajangana]
MPEDRVALSLSHRAPLEPIGRKIWEASYSLGAGSIEYQTVLEQPLLCVRLRVRSRRLKISIEGAEVTIGRAFAMGTPPNAAPLPIRRPQVAMPREAAGNNPPDRNGDGAGDILDWRRLPTSSLFSIDLSPVIRFKLSYNRLELAEVITRPTYIVVGIFPRGNSNPKELVVSLERPERLFWELHWATLRLRGLRNSLFSLSQVKDFRLYKCNAEIGTHERVELDENGVADLRLLLYTYKKWYVPDRTAKLWVNWIHQALNGESDDVRNGTYSLEIVLGWSATRISVVVLLPVLLSLAIGLYINSQNWTDLTTIQTAWSIASYVVTAGGLLAALLAILSGIEEIYG